MHEPQRGARRWSRLSFNRRIDHVRRTVAARLHQQVGKRAQEAHIKRAVFKSLHVISPADARSHIGGRIGLGKAVMREGGCVSNDTMGVPVS
jgi:hypothetical protein